MNKDDGAAEFGAVLVLFFLAAILIGLSLYTAANMVYFQRNKNEFQETLQADVLLAEIVEAMQPLRSYDYDDRDNAFLEGLRRTYANYDLDFEDVSSGWHLDFLSDKNLADSKLCEYLFATGNAAGFIDWRNLHGLSVSKDGWKPFIKEDAWESCVSYGWLHVSQAESFAFRTISLSFSSADTNILFPLINEFPMMNINMVTPEAVLPLVGSTAFEIPKRTEKTEALKNRMLHGPMALADISYVLDIPVTHDIFIYLGTKTAFWKLRFKAKNGLYVEAIVAAIPEQYAGVQDIREYQLIDRRFIRGP